MCPITSEAPERLVAPVLHLFECWGANDIRVIPRASSQASLPCITATCLGTHVVAVLATAESLRHSAALAQLQTACNRASRMRGCIVVFAFLADEQEVRDLLRQSCGFASNVDVWPV